MPVWAPHTLVTFGGTLNTDAVEKEIWQCGVRVMASGAGGPVADHAKYLTDVAPALATWYGAAGAGTGIPTSATLDWLKANPIGADGKYSDPAAHIHDYSPHVAGGANQPTRNPDILCLAISWVTAVAVRKHVYATHGRIYLPNYTALGNPQSSMRGDVAQAAAWATLGKNLLTVIGGGTQPAVPVVASGHNGEFHPIIGVKVGDVLDVQRRRKSALKENYSTVTFP